MKQKIISLLIFILPLFIATSYANAQNTYEEPQGRFVIDLPPGWQLAPQTNDKVYVFNGEGKSIIIEYIPKVNDTGALIKRAENTVRLSGLANPALEGDLLEMTVNDHPARWAVFKSGGPAGNIEVTLFSLCGGIALDENGLYFLAIIAQNDMPAWKEKLEKVFQSIRSVGQSVTGVKDLKTVSAPTAQGSPTVWKHELVTLTLPAGWKEKPKPRSFEKEIVGWFEYEPLTASNLLVICYKGFGMSKAKALDAGIKAIKITIPNAEPTEYEEIEVGGKKADFAVYKGKSVAQGTEVELVALLSVVKAEKCHLDLLCMGMPSSLPELKKQILEISGSVK